MTHCVIFENAKNPCVSRFSGFFVSFLKKLLKTLEKKSNIFIKVLEFSAKMTHGGKEGVNYGFLSN